MDIVVTYRRTRRMSMSIVKNGDVHVSVPYGVPREEVEKFIEENRQWIDDARKRKFARQAQTEEFFGQLPVTTLAEQNDVTRRMRELVRPLVARYSRQMGVTVKEIYYSAMTTRWGVCYSKRGRIGFSIYLLLLPEWCAEHVVVHELCHLLEPSHNERFHALMDRYFPRWREAREETARISRGAIGENAD